MLCTRKLIAALLVIGVLGLATTPAAATAPQRPQAETHTGTTKTRATGADCPPKQAPPRAVDTSEVPKPGETAPKPLPLPETPAGGKRMAECGLVLPKGAGQLPKHLDFRSWLLFDLNTGDVLAGKDPHGRYRPASTLKTLFSLVVLHNLKLNKIVTTTQEDANAEGTRVGVVKGGRYTVQQLLTALLLKSGNDVAHALARALGGPDKAVDKMNALASKLGCQDTRAATPSGLDGPGMSTSAYDMATIFRAAMGNPTFAKIVRTPKMRLPIGHGQSIEIANDNRLLGTYPGDIGGKTGFTDDAQHTYLNAADHGGTRIGLVMLHGMNHLEGMYRNANDLMNYGFTLSGAKLQPVGQLATPHQPRAQDEGNQNPAPIPENSHSSASSGPTWLIVLGALAVVVIALVVLLLLRRRKLAGQNE